MFPDFVVVGVIFIFWLNWWGGPARRNAKQEKAVDEKPSWNDPAMSSVSKTPVSRPAPA